MHTASGSRHTASGSMHTASGSRHTASGSRHTASGCSLAATPQASAVLCVWRRAAMHMLKASPPSLSPTLKRTCVVMGSISDSGFSCFRLDPRRASPPAPAKLALSPGPRAGCRLISSSCRSISCCRVAVRLPWRPSRL